MPQLVVKKRGVPSRTFGVVCAVGTMLCAIFAVVVGSVPGSTASDLITPVFLLTFGAFAAATAVRRMRMTRAGRRRRAWFTVSLGLCLGVLANGLALFLGWAGLAQLLGVVDALLLSALVLCIVALTLFPPTPRRGTDVARLLMDGLVVGGSVLFLASVTIFPTLLAGRDSVPGQLQVLALPVLDLVITTLATLMITRSGTSSRTSLRLLGAAFLLYTVSDMAYAVHLSAGSQVLGSWWDLGWLGGYLLVALAALHPDAGDQPSASEAGESSSLPSTIVCFTIFLAAAATSMAVDLRADAFFAPRVVWGLLIIAVVVRQIALVLDNESLRRSLEERVVGRTEELRQITRQRELLLASVADGIYGVDADGRITMVNEATTRLLGMDESRLIGADAHDLFHAPDRDGESFPREGCYITEATTSGLTVSGEDDVYVRGNGDTIAVEATASPLTSEQGITGAVVVFRDVSQRREMDRMKQEFISFVSHELRTPLTSIRGALGLISGGALGELPPKAARMIDIATTGSLRLGRLVDDILDIERLDSGMLPLVITPQDAASACREAVAATAGMAQATGIRLEVGVASGRVLADGDRLVQVLINLVGNAVRFSDPGSAVHLECAPGGALVTFAVSDTGRGIPPDKLEAIFGRFSQVDSSAGPEKAGTGLGLAICRGLVESMGGRIWAESTPGVGSTFRFDLPAVDHPLGQDLETGAPDRAVAGPAQMTMTTGQM